MNIKILTPEAVIFEGEVTSIVLPGKNGEFQMMKDHAAIVASLRAGTIKIFTTGIPEKFAKNFKKLSDTSTAYAFPLKSGVIEFNHNKGIILAE